MLNPANFSEMSLVQAMSVNLLSYADFITEIRRRVDAGESVHPYHAKAARLGREVA